MNKHGHKLNEEMKIDHVIIGAGPISIIEACYQISRGKEVLIIEERDRPGGAWGTIQYDGMPNVEVGCHVWDVSLPAYDFLEEFMKLKLQPLSPSPKIKRKLVRIPYDWKMNIATLKGVVRNLRTLNFKHLRASVHQPDFRWSLRPSKYLYPVNGAKDIEQAIHRLIEEYNIQIIFNQRVKSIQNDEYLKVDLHDGTRIVSDRLTMTSLSTVDSIVLNKKPLEFNVKPVDYIHLHLLLEDFEVRKFSYERVFENELIHRVSDMTSQVENEIDDSQYLLCVGVFENEAKAIGEHALKDKVILHLKELGYIKGEGEVVSSGVNVYSSFYNDPIYLEQVKERSNQKISVLHSTNFTYGIFHQLDRWRTVLTATN